MKIKVKVKPNSFEQTIKELEPSKYIIELTSPAEKNKANLELIKILSKHFRVKPKNIIIKAGLSNKEKLIEIKNEI